MLVWIIVYIIYIYFTVLLVPWLFVYCLNTLRTGDADLRFYVTTVQDG